MKSWSRRASIGLNSKFDANLEYIISIFRSISMIALIFDVLFFCVISTSITAFPWNNLIADYIKNENSLNYL